MVYIQVELHTALMVLQAFKVSVWLETVCLIWQHCSEASDHKGVDADFDQIFEYVVWRLCSSLLFHSNHCTDGLQRFGGVEIKTSEYTQTHTHTVCVKS